MGGGLGVADLAYVDAVRGDEELARAHLNELEQLTTSTSPALPAGMNRALGTLALGLGRPSEALDRLLASTALVRPQSNPMLVYGVPDATEAAARAQRSEEMAEHVARYATWVERFPNPTRRSLLARCQALADEADAEHRLPRRSVWSTHFPRSSDANTAPLRRVAAPRQTPDRCSRPPARRT